LGNIVLVILCQILTAGLAGVFKKESECHIVGIVLGVSLTLISFIFWKLDQRVRYLVKHAETALKELEKKWTDSNKDTLPAIALFCVEEKITSEIREPYGIFPWKWHLSYANCFSAVYIIFGSIGLLSFIGSVVKWIM